MDKQEAKEVLQALRPTDHGSDDPLVIEALASVERDPELKAWWNAQQAFDRKVAAKLAEIMAPSDLRANILAARKIEPFPQRPMLPYWLAMAAAVVILCVAGAFMEVNSHSPLPRTEYTASVLPLIKNDSPNLAMQSTDRDKVMAWLKDQHAPMGSIPPKMTSLPTIGCQKYEVHGHSVSLICFTLTDGKEAHLFIVNERALKDPPGYNTPEFAEANGWSMVSWSDGKMSYIMATTAGTDALKQLL
jgi:hypothetical protein